MKKKRSLIIAGAVVLVFSAAAFLSGSFAEASSSEQESGSLVPERFEVVHPVQMDTAYGMEYIADIQAVQHIELRSRLGGYIEHIYTDEGRQVKKGDLLFSISSQEFEAQMNQCTAALNNAQAELKAAEVDLKSTRELVDKNIVSVSQLELALAKVEAIAARVEEVRAQQSLASLNLSYAQVRAPHDGIIGRIPNKTGSLLEEGDLLTTISDNSRVYVYFNVTEGEYLDLTKASNNLHGQAVTLLLANHQPFAHSGKIETTDSQVNHETGNIAFRASFPNPDLLLKHGSTGKVRLEKTVRNALLIPQEATVEAQDILYVFAVDEDGLVRKQNIVPELRLPRLYVVESGLSPADRIVYKGQRFIREGDQIETTLTTFLPGASVGHTGFSASR